MAKIKNKNVKISRDSCINCFKSNHIVFSFAYVVYDNELNGNDKIALIDRIREVSSVNYLELCAWSKNRGFEDVRVNIAKEIPCKFIEEIAEFDGKYSIIRLYTNNNPTPGRIIGKLINKIFYVFYIDAKGVLYQH